MKTFVVRSTASAFLLTSQLWWASNAEAETHKVQGQVTAVHGVAILKVPGKPDATLKAGMDVPVGGVIVTAGSDASVDLFLGRNTGVIRLDGNSELRIATLQATDTGSETITDTRLVLQKGQVFGHVNKQSAASTYQLTLPDGTAIMHETRFQVVINEPGSGGSGPRDTQGSPVTGTATPTFVASSLLSGLSTVRILEGEATVHTRDGAVAFVSSSQEWSPSSGSPSGSTTPLSPTMASLIGQAFLTLDVTPPPGTESPAGSNQPNTQGTGNVIEVAARPITVPPQETPLSPTTGSR